jgi:hypothetical protein
MSTTSTKRPHRQALLAANAFQNLFDGCYERWEFAGSLRRKCSEVSDIDHVVIPAFEDRRDPSALFDQSEKTNLLWERAEHLVNHQIDKLPASILTLIGGQWPSKHLRINKTTCWGNRARSLEFREFTHELWTADQTNWGAQLTIRTGPGDFSRKMVTELQNHSYMNWHSHVYSMKNWFCEIPKCKWEGFNPVWVKGSLHKGFVSDPEGRESGPKTATCPKCGPEQIVRPMRLEVPDEETYFNLAGVPLMNPEDRR